MNTITIKFRAKLDDFAGGKGYKVPTLTASHVSIAERDTLAVLFMGSLNKPEFTKPRLKSYAGLDLPGVVWADSPGEWTVTPVGKGFMADVSITRPFERKRSAA